MKKHRHKWESYIVDCPLCGAGEVWECDCGEVKEIAVIRSGQHAFSIPKKEKKEK